MINPTSVEPHDAQQYEEWVSQFKKRQCNAYDAAEDQWIKRPVSSLLAEVESLTLANGPHERLTRNIVYACHKAETAEDPESEETTARREQLAHEFKLMRDHKEEVAHVRAYLDEHRKTAETAMAHASPLGATRRCSVTKETRSELAELRSALSKYEIGLVHISDFDHFAHISLDDFRYGPFDFSLDLRSADFPKIKAINQTGLIFHLTYLFRYFTSKKFPPTEMFSIGAFPSAQVEIGRDILDVSGLMISSGQPHTDLVAPLVNAVFDEQPQLRPVNVTDRLRALYGFSKGSIGKKRWPQAKKVPLFVGWR